MITHQFKGGVRSKAFLLAMAAAFLSAPAVSAGGFESLKAGSEASLYYLTPEALDAIALEAPPVPDAAAMAASSNSSYLTAGQAQVDNFPPPPAARSSADKADLAAVLQWQKDRTDAQCAAARAQSNESYEVFFGPVSPFPSPLPSAAAAFFRRVQSDGGIADRYLKNLFQRPRPFQQDPAVKPCLGAVGGYSYPSGHSTAAHLTGLILADLAPGKADKFTAYAHQAGLNRVIGGVHYPSDVEAGARLAAEIYSRMRRNPAFISDMNALVKYLSE